MTVVHKKFENWFSRLAALVYRRRYTALLLIFLLTAALAGQMTKLTIDTRDESFFAADDPALIAYNSFRDTFGQDDMFIISMRPHHGLTLDFLATLNELHHELEAKIPYLDDIISLVNGRIVYGKGDTLVVDELMPQPPQTEKELERLLTQIGRYPLYDKLLVSSDRSMTSILIKAQAVKPVEEKDLLAGFADDTPTETPAEHRYLSNEESIEIAGAINKVAAGFQGRDIDFHLTGTPFVVAELTSSIANDLRTMVPLSFLLIVLFLAALFRRISGVLYPLLIVFLSLISTMGIMGLTGIPITTVIQILPSFLVVVGIGDSVHIMTIFYRLYRKTNDKQQAIIEAMGYAGLPVLMTSVTTACGLFSFAWADLDNVAHLGLVAPAGVMLALLYTVVLLPALIAIFPIRPGNAAATERLPLADRLFTWIAAVTTRRPLLVSVVSAIIVSGALWSALSVKFAHNALTWFPRDSPVRVATELLDRVNGGTVMLEVLVDTGRENGLQAPDLQRRMSEAAATIPTMEVQDIRAAKAWSLADVLKETNRALHEGRDEFYTVPASRELIAQELILFESGGSDDLEDFANSTYQTGRLSILAPWTDAVLYKDYIDRISAYLAKQFPGEKVTLTGHIALFMQIIKKVITSMAKSYVFALVVISLLMVLLVGRVRIGLLSMIPNVVPIIFILGLMGMLNIPLDLSTMLIGSIVLGLVVDDTIHFLHHFRRAFEKSGDVETAVRETMFTTGRAMVITSMVLCGGFFIYTTAYLASSVRYGLLTGCAVIFALAADFFLVPALLSLVSLTGPTDLAGPAGQTSRTSKTVPIIFLLCLLPMLAHAGNDANRVRSIMQQVDARDDGDRSTADIQMVLIDKHGKKRSRTIRSFGLDQGNDRYSLMFFLAPADVKDTGFLTHDYDEAGRDDDQWLYLPALKKTKRIAASDKSGSFMGSDFSYADLTKRRLDDYTYSFNKEQQEAMVYGQQTWVIDCLPGNTRVIEENGYTRSILFVRQDNFMVVRAIHFVKDGGLRKYFDVKRMELVDNIWTSLEIHMTARKGDAVVHRTILTLDNVRYNQEAVDEKLFTVRTLEKGL